MFLNCLYMKFHGLFLPSGDALFCEAVFLRSILELFLKRRSECENLECWITRIFAREIHIRICSG